MKYQALRPHFFSVDGWLEGSRDGWWWGWWGLGEWWWGGLGWNCGWVGLVVRGGGGWWLIWWMVRGGIGWVNIMKDLKYEHESIFPLWGRVKLNFRDR